jgi:hypothetical protein
MNEDTTGGPAQRAASAPISRRTVMRTAAHAAWAVPVISAVTAAPAFAANSDVLTVSASATGDQQGRQHMDVTVTVGNPPGGSLAATVLVQFTSFSANVEMGSADVLVRNPVSAWPATAGPAPTFSVLSNAIANGGSASITMRLSFASGGKPGKGESVTIGGTASAAGFPVVQSFSAVAEF